VVHRKGLEGAAAQSGLPVDVRDRGRPRRVVRAANRVPIQSLAKQVKNEKRKKVDKGFSDGSKI